MIQPSAGNHRDRKVAADILGGIPEPMESMVMESHGPKGPRSERNHAFPFTWMDMVHMQNMLSMDFMLQLERKLTNACEKHDLRADMERAGRSL